MPEQKRWVRTFKNLFDESPTAGEADAKSLQNGESPEGEFETIRILTKQESDKWDKSEKRIAELEGMLSDALTIFSNIAQVYDSHKVAPHEFTEYDDSIRKAISDWMKCI